MNLNLTYKTTAESRELAVYIENTGELYRKSIAPTIKNLAKKYEKGIFDTEKALTVFYKIATEGAKMYAKEYANANKWNRIFSVTDRKATACELLEYYWENINGENPLN